MVESSSRVCTRPGGCHPALTQGALLRSENGTGLAKSFARDNGPFSENSGEEVRKESGRNRGNRRTLGIKKPVWRRGLQTGGCVARTGGTLRRQPVEITKHAPSHIARLLTILLTIFVTAISGFIRSDGIERRGLDGAGPPVFGDIFVIVLTVLAGS